MGSGTEPQMGFRNRTPAAVFESKVLHTWQSISPAIAHIIVLNLRKSQSTCCIYTESRQAGYHCIALHPPLQGVRPIKFSIATNRTDQYT